MSTFRRIEAQRSFVRDFGGTAWGVEPHGAPLLIDTFADIQFVEYLDASKRCIASLRSKSARRTKADSEELTAISRANFRIT